jgi:hypothetical protein
MESLPAEFFFVATLIIIALAGGLTVWLIRYASGGKSKRRRDPTAAEVSAPLPVAAPALSSEGEQELLRVSRTGEGELVVSVQGRPYRHLRQIADQQVEREAMEALKAVMAFFEGMPPSTPQAAPQAQQPSPKPPSRVTDRLPEPTTASALHKPGSMLDPLFLVEGIDDLLQQRVQERSDMAGRFIRLAAGPKGGLRIYVDQQVFESIDDITDPEVQALIRQVIREWEGS